MTRFNKTSANFHSSGFSHGPRFGIIGGGAKRVGAADGRGNPLPCEKIAGGQRAEFDAQHGMPLPAQPSHVQALAAQRDEHLPARLGQARPMLDQRRMDLVLVETDFVPFPALMPKCGLHRFILRLT
jgi:hypothetical protein